MEANELRNRLRAIREPLRDAKAVLAAGDQARSSGLAHTNATERITLAMNRLLRLSDELDAEAPREERRRWTAPVETIMDTPLDEWLPARAMQTVELPPLPEPLAEEAPPVEAALGYRPPEPIAEVEAPPKKPRKPLPEPTGEFRCEPCDRIFQHRGALEGHNRFLHTPGFHGRRAKVDLSSAPES